MKRNMKLMLFAFVCSAAILAICSQNSFLYQINEAASINMYLTIGKEMKYGKVPYLDIVDHKGPVQYFIYALSAWISETGYVGVYVIEVIAFGLFLYFFGKTIELYQNNNCVSYCVVAIMAVVTASSDYFFAGNSEELVLWLLAYSIYSVLRSIREERELTTEDAFCNGVSAGVIFWNKYTALGGYIGLVIFVVIWYLSDKGLGLKKLMKVVMQFLLGVATISGFVIGYFLKHHALDEMLSTYILWNILYSDGLGVFHSLHAKIADMIYYTCEAIVLNVGWASMVVVGFGWALISFKRNWKESCIAVLGLFMQWLAIYLPYRYFGYYTLVLAPFAVFGFIALNSFSERVFVKKNLSDRLINGILIVSSLIVSLSVMGIKCPRYFGAMRNDRESSVRTRFAEIMNRYENPTLLVYGVLDSGFYYVADISPTCKYFCKTNQENPEMMEMQNDFVENGRTQFVVTSGKALDEYEIDSSRYERISEGQGFYLHELKQ